MYREDIGTRWAEAQDSGAKTTTVIDISGITGYATGDNIVVRGFNLSGDKTVTSATLQFTTSAKVVAKLFGGTNESSHLSQSNMNVPGAADEDLQLVTVGAGAYAVGVQYDLRKANANV